MSAVRVEHGDCRAVVATLPDASVDSVITDPPYALVQIGRSLQLQQNGDGTDRTKQRNYIGRGFMGKRWDTGEVAFDPAFWADVLRVLKPGGHVVAFGGTRTYHRLAVAIEDAGFEIRDQIGWLYGSGFPKSHNVAGGIDKQNGIGPRGKAFNMKGRGERAREFDSNGREFLPAYEPVTGAARQWQGWGTALKPAWEPIVLARKPLIGTVAANVLAHGTGAINIDGCRVAAADGDEPLRWSVPRGGIWRTNSEAEAEAKGRWPANIIHDGSDEVVGAFPVAPGQQRATGPEFQRNANVYGKFAGVTAAEPRGDAGSAARFFYQAKADSGDRLGSKHPTVKPVDLMAWLCRLITPPGGTVLDPFAGSGSTGMACLREGFDAILIEREAEYVADIRRRLSHVEGGDTPLFAGAAQ